MGNNLLLVFSTPTRVEKSRLGGGPPSGPHLPEHRRQGRRLTPKFRELQGSFRSQTVAFQDDPAGAAPEQVIIFETVGSVDTFLTAVRHTPGMSWLAEWAEDEIPPDRDFYIEGSSRI